MRDRVERLANQAGIQLDYFGYGSCEDGGNPNIEKFAELLIKECADLTVNDPNFQDVKSVIRGVRQNILNHFGIN